MTRGTIKRMRFVAECVAPCLTPRRVINALRCEVQARRRTIRPSALPPTAIIDVANRCNLQCPYCPTGLRQDSGRKEHTVSIDLVRRFLDELGETLISVNLFNWGEPLLHPDLAEIVRECRSRRLFIQLSSNLNAGDGARLEACASAGLDYVMVSISGATQSTYEQYHRGGNLDRVVSNTRAMLAERRTARRRRPVVEWRYLLFTHNAHEVESCAGLAHDIGVDVFRVTVGGGPTDACVRPDETACRGACPDLWRTAVLEPDGGIAPCCYLFSRDDDFGDSNRESFRDVFLGERAVTARRLFSRAELVNLPPDLRHPCLKCHRVHDQSHLRRYLDGNPYAMEGHRTPVPWPYPTRKGEGLGSGGVAP